MTEAFAILNGMTILIREGLEAVVIFAAVLGTLRAAQHPRRSEPWLYAGAGAGILASLLTWALSQQVLAFGEASRELLEGVTSLVAAGVLFYVTNWVFHKAYVTNWTEFLTGRVGRALTAGSTLGLAGLGFTVVYREGFEVVLFYQALLFEASPTAVLIGFAAGCAVILGLAYAILRLSKSLPVGPLFLATSALMLVLAFSLVGAGFHALQEAGVIGETLLRIVPQSEALAESLGLHPTVETTAAQALFVVAVAVTFAISRWWWRRAGLTRSQPPAIAP